MRGEPREACGRSPLGLLWALRLLRVLSLTSSCGCSAPRPTSRELQAAAEAAPSLSSLLHAEVKPALGWGRHPLYLTARLGHLPGAKLPLHFEMPLQVPAKKEQLLRLPSALSSNSTTCQLPLHTLLMNAGSWDYLGGGGGRVLQVGGAAAFGLAL